MQKKKERKKAGLLNPREKRGGKEGARRMFNSPGNLIWMLSGLPDAS